jgi:excisionase family DNA binding protein
VDPTTTITTSEAARRANCSTDTIRRWCERGYLQALRVGPGRRYRIDPNELEKVVNGDLTDDMHRPLAEVSK